MILQIHRLAIVQKFALEVVKTRKIIINFNAMNKFMFLLN